MKYMYDEEFLKLWKNLINTLNDRVRPLREDYLKLIAYTEENNIELEKLEPHYNNVKTLFDLFNIKP